MRRLQTKFVADISRYTENFFLGMSPRQTLFGVAGGVLMALGSLLDAVPDAAAFLGGFALIAAGFWRPDGLPLEKYVRAWLDSHLVNPSRRHYDPEGIPYDYLWHGKAGGRVCFRPADFLKEEQDLPSENEQQERDADWPEEEAAPPEPEKPAPEAHMEAGGGNAGGAPHKAAPPEPPPQPSWPPAPVSSRVPRYGSGRTEPRPAVVLTRKPNGPN